MKLQIPRRKLSGLAAQFRGASYGKVDFDLLDRATRRIAAGKLDRKTLAMIFRWKNIDREKSRLDDNTDDEIRDAFRLAMSANTDRCAISVLTGLRGVAVPTASAILTAIDQDRYTVIDYRALESLGVECAPCTVDLYVRYVAFCRAEAARVGMSLRDFDRALWMASKNSN